MARAKPVIKLKHASRRAHLRYFTQWHIPLPFDRNREARHT